MSGFGETVGHRPGRLEQWDVVVVGAGPAGATLAALLAAQQVQVLLVDRHVFPRRKVCGGCLNGRAQSLLRSHGFQACWHSISSVALTRLRIVHGQRQIAVPLEGMRAIARDEFDQALVDAAVFRGAVFAAGTLARVEAANRGTATRVVELQQLNGDVRERKRVEARLVVIANGLSHRCLQDHSELAERVQPASRIGIGVRVPAGGVRMSSTAATNRMDPPCECPSGTLTMAIDQHGYVGMVRLADGTVNLASAVAPLVLKSQGPSTWVDRTLKAAGLPRLANPSTLDWQGTKPLTRTCVRPAAHRLVAVGDAAGYVEPFTGEGMAWAIESATLALPWVLRGLIAWSPSLEYGWRRELKQSLSRRQFACRMVSELLARPLAVRVSLATLSACPLLTRSLVRHFSSPVA